MSQIMTELPVQLATLAGGAAEQLFQAELAKAMRNIKDENTEAGAKREITLKVTIIPSDDRWACTVLIASGCKLAPIEGASSTMFVGLTSAGKLIAVEQNPKQQPLFPAPTTAPAETKE